MSTVLDEATAWDLVRTVPSRPGADRSRIRAQHDPRPDVWLQVHPSGSWETSLPPTDAARALLDLYLPLQIEPDLAIAQTGQSVDGRIATVTGHSHYVTGPADIQRLHRLRALVDAVVVGAGTVDADDPRLTVRVVAGSNPTRVVLDPRGRLDWGRHVFTDGAAPTLVIRDEAGDHAAAAGTLYLPVDDDGLGSRGFAPHAILDVLHQHGLRRVLIEGGGTTISRFLQARALDRLHVTVAPLLIGSGQPAVTLSPITSLDQALRPPCRHFHLGEDVLFDFALRRDRPAAPGRRV